LIVTKAQQYLPWIAVILCIVVTVTYLLTRPPAETYDQCMARQAHPEQTAEQRAQAQAECGKRPAATTP
jgi:hypothetical protein